MKLLALIALFAMTLPLTANAQSSKKGYFSDIDVRYVNYRIDRSTTGASSFSIVSNSSYETSLKFGYDFSKGWSLFAGTEFGIHKFEGPSSRTINDEDPNTLNFLLGAQWMSQTGYGVYVTAGQVAHLTLTDADSTTHAVDQTSMTLATLGTKFGATSKAGFRLNIDLSASLPVSATEIEGEEVQYDYSMKGAMNMEFGKKFFYGLTLASTIQSFSNGSDSYTSNQLYGGVFSKFYF